MKRLVIVSLIVLPFVVTLVLHVSEWDSNRHEVNWSNDVISRRNSMDAVDKYREQLRSEYRVTIESKENDRE